MQDPHFEKLIGCFEQIFPGMNRDDISVATHDTVAAWDSVAQVTLLSLIGEAFAIEIDFEEFEGANSFAAILELVRTKAASA